MVARSAQSCCPEPRLLDVVNWGRPFDDSPSHRCGVQGQWDGRWQTVAEVGSAVAENPRYGRCRGVRGANTAAFEAIAANLATARWCRSADLTAVEKDHLLRVLMEAPQHAEAISALNAVWREGQQEATGVPVTDEGGYF